MRNNNDVTRDLLERVARSETIAEKLRQIAGGVAPVAFEHVTEPARPFLAGLIARHVRRRIWVVCENVRAQEEFHNELLNWRPDALFFPELEVAPAQGALPDPEISAERLEMLQRLNAPTAGPRAGGTRGMKRRDAASNLESSRDRTTDAGAVASQVIVVSRASLDDEVPSPGALKQITLKLSRSARVNFEKLVGQLSGAGYERVAQVSGRGQFAVRGGILDVFSWQHPIPVRIEFFGDVIESIRQFDLDEQTSVQHVDACSLLLGETETGTCPLREYIGADDLVIESGNVEQASRLLPDAAGAQTPPAASETLALRPPATPVPHVFLLEGAASADAPEDFSGAFHDHGLGEFEAGDFVVEESKRERFFHQLRQWQRDGWLVHIFCNNEGEIERLRDLIPRDFAAGQTLARSATPASSATGERSASDEQSAASGDLVLTIGVVTRGFTFPAAKVAVLSDAELFGRYRFTRARRLQIRRAREQAHRAQIDFSELNEGDFVVHLEHGIARYLGLRKLPAVAAVYDRRGEEAQIENEPRSQSASTAEERRSQSAATTDAAATEVLVLEFADDARMYVPLEQSYLVSRYVGVGKRQPPLSALGEAKWARAKKSAEQAVFDYAAKLLAVQAERETRKGFAFSADGKWQHEFERSFVFKETPDQLTAIAATKSDMESEQPMDRLICGDVGFGKTEVAIRAAFKAVMSGKQVAVLCPTTVLAQQHWHTFRERMSDYPIVVEMLSRFRSPTEQRKTVKHLREGGVDIVIGTHRLISGDVRFKDLGLVVIDEEQRFGVVHKEKFKELFQLVDVLTLSATPIPRTLYLSLVGAKDMSIIETPPLNRIPTETIICPYDERVIRDAIRRELSRQGQVYFLHNRVMSIERIAQRVRDLVPEARVEIGHGQMDEHELEDVMQRFVAGETDVLVSTTIVESGLDIPNANTIIIDRADRFGLADLYQLRGRVGRAQHKAYAYLMLPRDLMTVGEARKRINAIKQYSSLGAGFKIAMRDLEIRGAGNILGTAQSGHIVAIGFDLYCQLLKQAVAKLKGEKVRPRIDLVLRLDFVATSEAEWGMTNVEARMTKEARSPNDEAGAPSSHDVSGFGHSSFIRHSSFVIRHSVAPAFLPVAYITEPQTRIQAYRRLAEVTTQEQLDALRKAWRDRFGPLPDAVENLLVMTEIKLAATARKVTRVEVRESKLMLTRGGDFLLIGGKFPRLTSDLPNLQLREVLALIKGI
jgi:transcription-repair coupling factor (superfamily II helicase)